MKDAEFIGVFHDGKANRVPSEVKQDELFRNVVIKESVRKTETCRRFDQLDLDRKTLRNDGEERTQRVGDLWNYEEHDRDRFVEMRLGLSLEITTWMKTHFDCS